MATVLLHASVRPGYFDDSDLAIIDHYADQSAFALTNARL
jgi:GAF domain-containing protein